MKKSELKHIIREEIKKIISEDKKNFEQYNLPKKLSNVTNADYWDKLNKDQRMNFYEIGVHYMSMGPNSRIDLIHKYDELKDMDKKRINKIISLLNNDFIKIYTNKMNFNI